MDRTRTSSPLSKEGAWWRGSAATTTPTTSASSGRGCSCVTKARQGSRPTGSATTPPHAWPAAPESRSCSSPPTAPSWPLHVAPLRPTPRHCPPCRLPFSPSSSPPLSLSLILTLLSLPSPHPHPFFPSLLPSAQVRSWKRVDSGGAVAGEDRVDEEVLWSADESYRGAPGREPFRGTIADLGPRLVQPALGLV